MSLTKLLKVLKGSQAALDLLDQSGVNIDRLIGISNAQGPQGRIVRQVISTIAETFDPHNSNLDTLVSDVKQLPSPPSSTKSRPKTKKPTKAKSR